MIAAIVPACGQSERMGLPKLLLPIDGVPLMTRVVKALREGGASPVAVVVAQPYQRGAWNLAKLADSAGAIVAIPSAPTADMRGSFERGLDNLEYESGAAIDGVLLVPGDSPALTPALVRALITAFDPQTCDALVPTVSGRRAHPLLLSWAAAQRVRDLPSNQGINSLLKQPDTRVSALPWSDPRILLDLDTPEDYGRWSPAPPT